MLPIALPLGEPAVKPTVTAAPGVAGARDAADSPFSETADGGRGFSAALAGLVAEAGTADAAGATGAEQIAAFADGRVPVDGGKAAAADVLTIALARPVAEPAAPAGAQGDSGDVPVIGTGTSLAAEAGRQSALPAPLDVGDAAGPAHAAARESGGPPPGLALPEPAGLVEGQDKAARLSEPGLPLRAPTPVGQAVGIDWIGEKAASRAPASAPAAAEAADDLLGSDRPTGGLRSAGEATALASGADELVRPAQGLPDRARLRDGATPAFAVSAGEARGTPRPERLEGESPPARVAGKADVRAAFRAPAVEPVAGAGSPPPTAFEVAPAGSGRMVAAGADPEAVRRAGGGRPPPVIAGAPAPASDRAEGSLPRGDDQTRAAADDVRIPKSPTRPPAEPLPEVPPAASIRERVTTPVATGGLAAGVGPAAPSATPAGWAEAAGSAPSSAALPDRDAHRRPESWHVRSHGGAEAAATAGQRGEGTATAAALAAPAGTGGSRSGVGVAEDAVPVAQVSDTASSPSPARGEPPTAPAAARADVARTAAADRLAPEAVSGIAAGSPAAIDAATGPEPPAPMAERALDGPARGEGPSGRAAELPRPVGVQIAEALRAAPGSYDVTLSPEELGRLTLTLAAQDGTMTVSIAAERPETLDLIRRHVDLLVQEARAAGFEDVAFGFSDGAASGSGAERHFGHPPAEAAMSQDAQPAARETRTTPPSPYPGSGLLDLRL